MKVDNFDGYETDASVNCDSVGGSLRTSKSGKVYKETLGKYTTGPISNGAVADLDACF